MAVLERPELTLSITYTQNEVAGAASGLHAVDGFIQCLVPLQNVPKNKGERVSEPALLSESIIGIGDTDFRNCQLMLIHTGKHTDPSHEADVDPGITELRTAGVVNHNKGEFVVGSIEILHLNIFTQSRALSWTVWPLVVAFPQAPNIEQAPLVSSPIMWTRLKYLKSTPLPSAMPRIYS